MEIIKIIGVGLCALIIIIVLKQYKPEFAIYISILAGAIILAMSVANISGVINLMKDISSKANINSQFLGIILKITGIAILTEFAISICKDSGETAIANKIDIGGKAIIITISLPIISSLLETILKILP
jgi:stage III sporulation protein AD